MLMALERIFYATHGVTLDGGVLKGVQSVSFTSNTNIEPIFQLGQLSHVEAIPTTPEVEVTITRAVVNGPAFQLAITDDDLEALEAKLQTPHEIGIGIVGGASGFTVKDAYLSSYTVNFSTEGVFTEELSYVGEKLESGGAFSALNDVNLHMPRRQDFSGLDDATSASVSVNFNRESIYRLGQFKPFLRTVTFPIDCTLQYNKLLPEGGNIGQTEPPDCAAVTLDEISKTISACGGSWTINRARLSSIGWTGGDTGGGNVEVQYTYSSWNNLIIA
jgi:hypothetical protein